MADFPTTILGLSGLAAYWRLGDPYQPSPSALTFPGADDTSPGVHVNRIAGPFSLAAGDIVAIHLTTVISGGTNPNLGLFSSAGGVNVFTGTNPPVGWYFLQAGSAQSDYFLYSYTGGTYAASLAGAGSQGVGGGGVDIGPHSLGPLGVNGNPTWSQATLLGGGQTGGSILFGGIGTGQFLKALDSAFLDLADSYSLIALIMPTTQTGQHGIISKGSGAYYMRQNAQKVGLLKDLVAGIVETGNVLSTSTRALVICTKNGATVKQYVDGVDVTGSVSNQTCVDTTSFLEIGGDVGNGEEFQGYIAEVAVVSGALSSGDATTVWTAVDATAGGGGSNARSVAAFMG